MSRSPDPKEEPGREAHCDRLLSDAPGSRTDHTPDCEFSKMYPVRGSPSAATTTDAPKAAGVSLRALSSEDWKREQRADPFVVRLVSGDFRAKNKHLRVYIDGKGLG